MFSIDYPHLFSTEPIYGIFEINLQYTFARYKKYSSELDISRSLIRIFAVDNNKTLYQLKNECSRTLSPVCKIRHTK